MNKYKIILKKGKSFKCTDLSEDHIKNLKACNCVKDVKKIRNNKK